MDNGLGFRQRHKQNHPQKLPLLSHASSVIQIGVMFLVFTVWWQRVFDYVSLCFYWDDSCPGVLFIFFSCCLFLAGHLALRQIFRQTEVIWKSALKPRITRGLKYTSSIGRLNLELTLLQDHKLPTDISLNEMTGQINLVKTLSLSLKFEEQQDRVI